MGKSYRKQDKEPGGAGAVTSGRFNPVLTEAQDRSPLSGWVSSFPTSEISHEESAW